MTLTLQEISDRLEIQDLLFQYADAIDQKRFDDLYDVFSEDAHVDYSVFGGSVGNRVNAYGNFFLNGCEGLRFYGDDHKIYSNYFEGCSPSLQIGNGDGTVPDPGPLSAASWRRWRSPTT
jgi:hypothetical protein